MTQRPPRKPRKRDIDPDNPFAALLGRTAGGDTGRRDVTMSGSGRSAAPATGPLADPPPPATPEPPARRQVTADELMREAFEAAGATPGLHARKFSGQGYTAEPELDIIDERDPEPDLAPVPTSDDDGAPLSGEAIMFYELMNTSGVQALETRVRTLRAAMEPGLRWRDEVELSSLSPDELAEPTLTGAQRDLLRRSRREGAITTISIRMLRRAEAIAEVEATVHAARQRQQRFVRVITGKGRHSSGPPVLKPAVVEWAERGRGHSLVLGWAPETDRSGAWGAVVLELTRSDRAAR